MVCLFYGCVLEAILLIIPLVNFSGWPALNSWLERLYGFDVFISYTRRDDPNSAYALALQTQLAQGSEKPKRKPMRCFLDLRDLPHDDELKRAIEVKIRASTFVLFVAGPNAADHSWMCFEAEMARKHKRRMIVIDRGIDWASSTGALKKEVGDVLAIGSDRHQTQPVAEIEGVAGTVGLLRLSRLRRAIWQGVAMALSVLLIAAILLWLDSEAQKKTAETRRQEADQQRKVAQGAQKAEKEQRTAAETARDNEKTQRLLVQQREGEQRKLLHDASMADCSAGMQRIEGAGRWHEGVAHIARALEWEPNNKVAAAWLYSTLAHHAPEQQNWPRRILKHSARVVGAHFSPDGARIVTIYADRAGMGEEEQLYMFGKVENEDAPKDEESARIWDVASGQPIGGPLKHGGQVVSASFSPDGTRLVTASEDDTAQLWDTASGAAIGSPMKHGGAVHDARFSPDGTRVVTASEDGTACIWNAASGQPLGEPSRHGSPVYMAAFSPDGSAILTTNEGKVATLWNAATRKILRTFKHDVEIGRAAFSPDGTRVVVAGETLAFVWETASGKRVGQPLRHSAQIYGVEFSPDGAWVSTASLDETACIWDAATGLPVGDPIRHNRPVISARFSPDGSRFVTASEDGTAKVWAVEREKALLDRMTIKSIGTPLYHLKEVRAAEFSPDGTQLVTASEDFTARIWDAPSDRPMGEPLRQNGEVYAAHFNRDGSRVLTVGNTDVHNEGEARVYETATGRFVRAFPHTDDSAMGGAFSRDGSKIITHGHKLIQTWDVASGKRVGSAFSHGGGGENEELSPDGRRVATFDDQLGATVWDLETGALVGKHLKHGSVVSRPVFSRDGKRLITHSELSDSRWTRVWEVETGSQIGPLVVHEDSIEEVEFNADGTSYSVRYEKLAPRIFDVGSGKAISQLSGHKGPVQGVQFSPSGLQLLTVGEDQTARLWAAASGKPIGKTMPHFGLQRADFSPDGSLILTIGETAQLWTSADGKPVGKPLKQEGPIDRATFSPDGSRLITAGENATARLWDRSGNPIGEPLRHEGEIQDVCFSPDGLRIATAGADKTARVWDATTARAISGPIIHKSPVQTVSFSPDGTKIVTATKNEPKTPEPAQPAKGPVKMTYDQLADSLPTSTVTVWDAATGDPLASPIENHSTGEARFTPDGSQVLFGARWRAGAEVWDWKTGELVAKTGKTPTATFSHNGTVVLTRSRDDGQVVHFWDVGSGNAIGQLLAHEQSVDRAEFSPDDSRVLTISDGTVRLWETMSGKAIGGPIEQEKNVFGVQFSTDGSEIFTFSESAVRVWKTASGASAGREFNPLPTLGNDRRVRANSQVSRDNSRVLILDSDSTSVWDLVAGKIIGQPMESFQTTDAEFSPDGSMVTTASMHQTACVWDPSGRLLIGHLIHDHQVSEAEFSPDGSLLLTASLDETARLWPVRTMLNPPLPVPPWFLERARAIAGLKFKNDGEMEPISLAQRLAVIHAPVEGDDAWARLARWMVQPARERKSTPDSQFTCRELAERERDFGSPTSLESALRFDPSVPLAHLLLAGAYMGENISRRTTLRGSFSPQRIAFLREFDLQHLPDDAALWERAIRALHEQKQSAHAKRALEKLSRLSPEKAAQLKIQLAL